MRKTLYSHWLRVFSLRSIHNPRCQMRRLYLPAPRIVRTFVTSKRISLQGLASTQGEQLPWRKCNCENTPMQKTLLAMLQAVALLAVPAALAEERPTLPDESVHSATAAIILAHHAHHHPQCERYPGGGPQGIF